MFVDGALHVRHDHNPDQEISHQEEGILWSQINKKTLNYDFRMQNAANNLQSRAVTFTLRINLILKIYSLLS